MLCSDRRPFAKVELRSRGAAVLGAFALVALGNVPALAGKPDAVSHAAHWRAFNVRSAGPYDWPEKGFNAAHTAYVADPNVSTATIGTLGVARMTNLLDADVGGPTVALNPTTGHTVVYVGDERGDLEAYDENSGQQLWSTSLGIGNAIYSTPLVTSQLPQGVWVGSAVKAAVYRLDASTGKITCTMPQINQVQASATEGQTTTGSWDAYIPTTDGTKAGGPELAYDETTCSTLFDVNPWLIPNMGAWASPAYAIDANGRSLILQGTADPDDTAYAIDATSGALDWDFVTNQIGDHDIGAGATISAPGNNGIADGVDYTIDKNGTLYAIDLTTGALLWQYDFTVDEGPAGGGRSSAALAENTVVFGVTNGVDAVNATTGARLWHWKDEANVEVISSPVIVGPSGAEVVACADLAGTFHILSMATGQELYSYRTGNYITASPAYTNGHFLITSADGFLYDFALGGGNGAHPSTSITSPTRASQVPYPAGGSVVVSGTATDAAGVSAVQVGIQSGGTSGLWYNATTNTWQTGGVVNTFAVATPGATSTTWQISVPVPPNGTAIQVDANAVNVSNLADVSGSQVGFSVLAGGGPVVSTAATYVPPGGSFAITGSGFTTKETVRFKGGGVGLGKVVASSTGTFSATITLPATSSFGLSTIIATGQKSLRAGTVTIYVANAWAQAGDVASHGGYEANDAIFARIIDPGGNTYLKTAWQYGTGSAIESSPAVSSGILYFGNDAGTLSAIDAITEMPIWSYTLASGAPIRSAPALDATTASVVFTADDGYAYILDAANGASPASLELGGIPTSASVANGVAYVGTDAGVISAVDIATDSLVWSTQLGGPDHATPAYDSANGIVVTGDDTGTITALAASTGTVLWHVVTGGPVTAAPTIAKGIVYAGSSDGSVYALGESSGTSVWTYAIGSPITAGADYDPVQNAVYVGGANAKMYALGAVDGNLLWSTIGQHGATSPFVGVSSVLGVVFGNNAAGMTVSFRSDQSGRYESTRTTGSTFETSPAIEDGTVYASTGDGGVFAFTPYGKLPGTNAVGAGRLRTVAAARARRVRGGTPASPSRSFSIAGRRDVGIRADVALHGSRPALRLAYHGGPVQTAPVRHIVFWDPRPSRVGARYRSAIVASLAGLGAGARTPVAAYVDSRAVPAQLTDAAVQGELARAIAFNHWSVSSQSQFVIVTGEGATAPNLRFCGYHSAFALSGNRAADVVYAYVPFSAAVAACGAPATRTVTGDPGIDAGTVEVNRVSTEMAIDPFANAWYDASGTDSPR
jgi:outer membrane protein assembly factor BamB